MLILQPALMKKYYRLYKPKFEGEIFSLAGETKGAKNAYFWPFSMGEGFILLTSKVDVDPRSFEFIHDKPPLPRQSK